MPYLLDTNALSEVDKPLPDQEFMKWFAQVDASELLVSCLTVGELYKGIALQSDLAKRQKLERRTDQIIEAFGEHILGVDQSTAKLWAALMAQATRTGRPSPAIDTLIAAQCLQHQLILVTRNLKDFQRFVGLQTLSPWAVR